LIYCNYVTILAEFLILFVPESDVSISHTLYTLIFKNSLLCTEKSLNPVGLISDLEDNSLLSYTWTTSSLYVASFDISYTLLNYSNVFNQRLSALYLLLHCFLCTQKSAVPVGLKLHTLGLYPNG